MHERDNAPAVETTHETDGVEVHEQGGDLTAAALDLLGDHIEPDLHRVASRNPQPEAGGEAALVLIEPTKPGCEHEVTGALVELGAERRREGDEPVGERLTDVQERGAARSAEELPGGRERDVASDHSHVDRHLPDGLSDVERIDGSAAREHLPDLSRIGQRAHVGRHVGHEHEPHAIVEQVLEGLEVDRPVGQRSHLDQVDPV